MNPEQFLHSVYLGDRACKAILMAMWKKQLAFQVDVISRLKPGAKTWDFYTGADVTDGWLVFGDVRSVRFEPSGPVPNDLINGIQIRPIATPEGKSVYLFEISIASVDDAGNSTEVRVEIEASQVHIEDPARPGVQITS